MSVSDDDNQSPHRFSPVNPTTHTARILIDASDLPVGPLVAPRGYSEFSVGPDFFENIRRENFAPTAPPGASVDIVTEVRRNVRDPSEVPDQHAVDKRLLRNNSY
jgi:hypothetical protein